MYGICYHQRHGKKCYLAHQFKGGQQIVGEDRGPAHEEDRHDQDQHVDHLGHHDDDDFGGEKDVDDDQAEEEEPSSACGSP